MTRIDSGRNVDTSVRCDIYSRSDEDTRLARSTKLRAAWPKPSEDLDRQDVPETSTVKFFTGDTKKVDLPIRDVIQRYTDSTAHTEVEWPGYNDEFQTFIWNMKRGTGVATASMPWVAIFEAYDRPRGEIECTARFGDERTQMKLPFLQQEWPITDDQPNADDVDTGEASNVE